MTVHVLWVDERMNANWQTEIYISGNFANACASSSNPPYTPHKKHIYMCMCVHVSLHTVRTHACITNVPSIVYAMGATCIVHVHT